MFCSNCGKEIKENLNFCPHCGFKFNKNEPCTGTDDNLAHCPQCNSTDISVTQKGYNNGAIGCGCLLFLLGFITVGISWIVLIIVMLCGFAGSGDSVCVCKKCGYKWGLSNASQERQKMKNLEKMGDNISNILWGLFFFILIAVLFAACTGLLPEPAKTSLLFNYSHIGLL